MKTTLLTADEIRETLKKMKRSEMVRLAELSGVNINTLQKIRLGQTGDPGLRTVAKFWPHVSGVTKESERDAKAEAKRKERRQPAIRRVTDDQAQQFPQGDDIPF